MHIACYGIVLGGCGGGCGAASSYKYRQGLTLCCQTDGQIFKNCDDVAWKCDVRHASSYPYDTPPHVICTLQTYSSCVRHARMCHSHLDLADRDLDAEGEDELRELALAHDAPMHEQFRHDPKCKVDRNCPKRNAVDTTGATTRCPYGKRWWVGKRVGKSKARQSRKANGFLGRLVLAQKCPSAPPWQIESESHTRALVPGTRVRRSAATPPSPPLPVCHSPLPATT